MKKARAEPHPSSFRDPSGHLYWEDGVLLRQVNLRYQEDYERLMGSGLYEALVSAGLLIAHREVETPLVKGPGIFRILQPDTVPFVSYPYEWCFSQLKDAAIATLQIQRLALRQRLSLKDATAYNIQFHQGRPVLIDTLSFESYRAGQPWVAYRQFCQHFLAPLALMARVDIRLGQLRGANLDGVPLDLAARLLPRWTRLNPHLGLHVYLHAASIRRYAGRAISRQSSKGMGLSAHLGLIDSLESAVRSLAWKAAGTAWVDYAASGHYSEAASTWKRSTVGEWVGRVRPGMAWDLGANVGEYSRIACQQGAFVVSIDSDPAAVEKNYLGARQESATRLLPLLVDLTNPSPGLGWGSEERASLIQRGPADAALALALIHHLVISNNLPFERVAGFLAKVTRWLIIEYVPKTDPMAAKLLASRQDIFEDYTLASFEAAFRSLFTIHQAVPLPETERILYLMERTTA